MGTVHCNRLSCLRPWRKSRSNRRARRQPKRRKRQLSRAQTRLTLWTHLQMPVTARRQQALLTLLHRQHAPGVRCCKGLRSSARRARLAVLAASPLTISSHHLLTQASLALLLSGVCHQLIVTRYTRQSVSLQAYNACLAVAAAQSSLPALVYTAPAAAEALQSPGPQAAACLSTMMTAGRCSSAARGSQLL